MLAAAARYEKPLMIGSKPIESAAELRKLAIQYVAENPKYNKIALAKPTPKGKEGQPAPALTKKDIQVYKSSMRDPKTSWLSQVEIGALGMIFGWRVMIHDTDYSGVAIKPIACGFVDAPSDHVMRLGRVHGSHYGWLTPATTAERDEALKAGGDKRVELLKPLRAAAEARKAAEAVTAEAIRTKEARAREAADIATAVARSLGDAGTLPDAPAAAAANPAIPVLHPRGKKHTPLAADPPAANAAASPAAPAAAPPVAPAAAPPVALAAAPPLAGASGAQAAAAAAGGRPAARRPPAPARGGAAKSSAATYATRAGAAAAGAGAPPPAASGPRAGGHAPIRGPFTAELARTAAKYAEFASLTTAEAAVTATKGLCLPGTKWPAPADPAGGHANMLVRDGTYHATIDAREMVALAVADGRQAVTVYDALRPTFRILAKSADLRENIRAELARRKVPRLECAGGFRAWFGGGSMVPAVFGLSAGVSVLDEVTGRLLPPPPASFLQPRVVLEGGGGVPLTLTQVAARGLLEPLNLPLGPPIRPAGLDSNECQGFELDLSGDRAVKTALHSLGAAVLARVTGTPATLLGKPRPAPAAQPAGAAAPIASADAPAPRTSRKRRRRQRAGRAANPSHPRSLSQVVTPDVTPRHSPAPRPDTGDAAMAGGSEPRAQSPTRKRSGSRGRGGMALKLSPLDRSREFVRAGAAPRVPPSPPRRCGSGSATRRASPAPGVTPAAAPTVEAAPPAVPAQPAAPTQAPAGPPEHGAAPPAVPEGAVPAGVPLAPPGAGEVAGPAAGIASEKEREVASGPASACAAVGSV
jgi:hypothetical protein